MVEDVSNMSSGRRGWQEMKTVASLFHPNQRTGQYKVFEIQEAPDGRILISMRQGISGQKGSMTTIVIQLTEQEIAYLAKIFDELIRRRIP